MATNDTQMTNGVDETANIEDKPFIQRIEIVRESVLSLNPQYRLPQIVH